MPNRKLFEVKAYRVSWIMSVLLKYGSIRKEEVEEEFDCSVFTARRDMTDAKKYMEDLYYADMGYLQNKKGDVRLVLKNKDKIVSDIFKAK